MKITLRKIAIAIFCILFLIIVCGGYFTATRERAGEGFAIYLTQRDIPPSRMEAMSHVDLSEQPIISLEDVITYNAQTHEMRLTSNASERIFELDVPVTGRSFMVCVDKEPIYWGAFWTTISSISFDGVTVWKPYSTQGKNVIVFELGYPSPSFYGGEDPRNNTKVLESLEKVGKLVTRLTLTAVDELPHSMKGYEMYSWEEGGQWRFTLITGTDRVKTMGEITSAEDYISETGWVNIHMVGVDAVKYVLAKFPEGESVCWCGELHIGQTMGQIDLQLPPKTIMDAIIEHADSCGLELVITVS